MDQAVSRPRHGGCSDDRPGARSDAADGRAAARGPEVASERLSPREREVLALVVTGLKNKQIAFQLNVAEITVKAHRGHVMQKMGAQSVADLVKMTEALGIKSPPS